jgi:CheY-like chemotaxis protein
MNATYHEMKRVLVICGREDSAARIATILTGANYTPFATTSAPMGLLMAVERAPHAIVCEANMAGLSGVSILKLLNGNRAAAAIPRLLITESAAVVTPGATLTLPAGFSAEQLLQAVEKCLGAGANEILSYEEALKRAAQRR